MNIIHVAYSTIGPSWYTIYDTGTIVIHYFIHYFDRIMLSPAFVKNHPCSDTGIETQAINHLEQFLLPLYGVNNRSIPVCWCHVRDMFFFLTCGSKTGHHILPHHQTQRIGIVIIKFRLHFDMFTYRIKTHFFQFHHIPQHRFLRRWSEQAIGPPSLVQRSVLENRLIIQAYTLIAAIILSYRYFTHGKITGYIIQYFSSMA